MCVSRNLKAYLILYQNGFVFISQKSKYNTMYKNYTYSIFHIFTYPMCFLKKYLLGIYLESILDIHKKQN